MLITDGDMKVSVPVLRSLAKKNIETGVAATNKRAICFFSRYCKNRLLYPSPRENRDLFLKVIRKIVEIFYSQLVNGRLFPYQKTEKK